MLSINDNFQLVLQKTNIFIVLRVRQRGDIRVALPGRRIHDGLSQRELVHSRQPESNRHVEVQRRGPLS